MSAARSGRTRPTKPKKQAGSQKRKREDVDVDKLQQAVADLVRIDVSYEKLLD